MTVGGLILPLSQAGLLPTSASKERDYSHYNAVLFPVSNFDEHGCHKRSSHLELDTNR